ncbi:MAG: non-canonical purine NTP pyrophosphatase [Fibrobacteres bacterium]|nr:non-canonical purine NTP pyrophosphatase [Fibrobacterota bacterium]
MSKAPRILALATGNAHKLQEFSEILAPTGWEVKSLKAWLPTIPEPEETEPDFPGNALLKAKFALAKLREAGVVNLPDALAADDSGLAVDALGGAPGVVSARYAELACTGSGDAANRAELIRNLSGKGGANDRFDAAFVCAIAFLEPSSGRFLTVHGKCHGQVGLVERGEGGFGYDSLFHPKLPDGSISEATFAQMPSEAKHGLSHRGNALQNLLAALSES